MVGFDCRARLMSIDNRQDLSGKEIALPFHFQPALCVKVIGETVQAPVVGYSDFVWPPDSKMLQVVDGPDRLLQP